jgi:hypothetical protein
MLDDWITQGIGLHRLAAPTPLRIVTVASHGDKASELNLLWSLCTTWSGLGYSIAMLDATVSESPAQPGFEQLLDGDYWDEDPQHGSAWSILSAARGLVRLHQQAADDKFPLHLVPNWFPQNDILVVYADTDTLVSFFPDSGMEPLLTMSPQKSAMLTAYQSVKHLLLNARLRPTIVSLVDSSTPTVNSAPLSAPTRKLQDCAQAFLGEQIPAMVVSTARERGRASPDLERLALLLLENSISLERGSAFHEASHNARSPAGYAAWSH